MAIIGLFSGQHNTVGDMKTLPLSEVKMKLSSLIEVVRVTDEEIVITKNGYPAAVLVSPDEFEGWRETLAIHDDSDLLAEIKKKDWHS